LISTEDHSLKQKKKKSQKRTYERAKISLSDKAFPSCGWGGEKGTLRTEG
jgi:hypothetical protein